MVALGPLQILEIWERGAGRPAAERALVLLAAAEPDQPITALASLPISHRDARLLEIREATFGPRLDAHCTCPRCGERLEFELATTDLLQRPASREIPPLHVGEYELEIRLPDSGDLVAAARCRDFVDARRLLAHRAIRAAQRHGSPVEPDTVPDNLIGVIADHLGASDPGGDLTLEVKCPACEAESQLPFDSAGFLWREIEAEAARLFRDVHRLAGGYGWREADILAMTPMRRRVYVDLLGS